VDLSSVNFRRSESYVTDARPARDNDINPGNRGGCFSIRGGIASTGESKATSGRRQITTAILRISKRPSGFNNAVSAIP